MAHDLCNHIIGFLKAVVPLALRNEHPANGLIAVSDIEGLVKNCRDHFARHPVPKIFTEQFFADDDEAQLDALIGRFKFCPYCGERLL